MTGIYNAITLGERTVEAPPGRGTVKNSTGFM